MSEDINTVGTIQVTQATELSFFLDTFNGKRYANIRKFSKSERYTGATKQGIKLSLQNLQAIVNAKDAILSRCADPQEAELCRTPKNSTTDVVVKLVLYEGHYGLDFREMFKTKDGEGFGKGIRLKLEHVEEAFQYIEKMLAEFNSQGASGVSEPPTEYDPKGKKDMPGDIKKYF